MGIITCIVNCCDALSRSPLKRSCGGGDTVLLPGSGDFEGWAGGGGRMQTISTRGHGASPPVLDWSPTPSPFPGVIFPRRPRVILPAPSTSRRSPTAMLSKSGWPPHPKIPRHPRSFHLALGAAPFWPGPKGWTHTKPTHARGGEHLYAPTAYSTPCYIGYAFTLYFGGRVGGKKVSRSLPSRQKHQPGCQQPGRLYFLPHFLILPIFPSAKPPLGPPGFGRKNSDLAQRKWLGRKWGGGEKDFDFPPWFSVLLADCPVKLCLKRLLMASEWAQREVGSGFAEGVQRNGTFLQHKGVKHISPGSGKKPALFLFLLRTLYFPYWVYAGSTETGINP